MVPGLTQEARLSGRKARNVDEKKLQQVFYQSRCGSEILRCIQCGTCSGSCPLTAQMDHGPRELFALIRDGEMGAALAANTQWFCVSCYQCMARCPQDIPVTDLMYTLKEMAAKHNPAASAQKMSHLYRAFLDEVDRTGRMNESYLMARYGLRHPMDMVPKALLGLKLAKRRRLELFSEKTRHPARRDADAADDTERNTP